MQRSCEDTSTVIMGNTVEVTESQCEQVQNHHHHIFTERGRVRTLRHQYKDVNGLSRVPKACLHAVAHPIWGPGQESITHMKNRHCDILTPGGYDQELQLIRNW